jgi:hypothetical protein
MLELHPRLLQVLGQRSHLAGAVSQALFEAELSLSRLAKTIT